MKFFYKLFPKLSWSLFSALDLLFEFSSSSSLKYEGFLSFCLFIMLSSSDSWFCFLFTLIFVFFWFSFCCFPFSFSFSFSLSFSRSLSFSFSFSFSLCLFFFWFFCLSLFSSGFFLSPFNWFSFFSSLFFPFLFPLFFSLLLSPTVLWDETTTSWTGLFSFVFITLSLSFSCFCKFSSFSVFLVGSFFLVDFFPGVEVWSVFSFLFLFWFNLASSSLLLGFFL